MFIMVFPSVSNNIRNARIILAMPYLALCCSSVSGLPTDELLAYSSSMSIADIRLYTSTILWAAKRAKIHKFIN